MPRVGNTSFPANPSYIGLSSVATRRFGGTACAAPAKGWITDYALTVATDEFASSDGTGRLSLFVNRSRMHLGASRSFPKAYALRTESLGTAARVDTGDDVGMCLWANSPRLVTIPYASSGGTRASETYLDNEPAGEPSLTPTTIPAGYVLSGGLETRPAYYDYVANAAPSTGTWQSSSPTGEITDTTPTFAGNTPHNGGDGAYDYTDQVQLRITNTTTGSVVYNPIFNTTQAQKDAKTFSHTITTELTPGHSYKADFRHKDSWGVWTTNWSSERTFSIIGGPDAPTVTMPTKINLIDAYAIPGTYNNTNGVSANRLRFKLWNAAGTSLLDTFESAQTLTPGQSFSVTEAFPTQTTLAWGTSYNISITARDTNNVWGEESALHAFKTNSEPNAPTGHDPAGDIVTGTLNFAVDVSDPDPQDTVTAAQMRIYNATTGVIVGANTRAMTVSGSRATYAMPASDLVAGTRYRWQARANDGHPSGYGAWSANAFFTHAQAPDVQLKSPGPGRTNLLKQPKPPPEGVTLEWLEVNGSAGTNYTEVIQEPESTEGALVFRTVVAAANTYKWTSPFYDVDATRPYRFVFKARRVSADAMSATFRIRYYDASNAELGSHVPASLAQLNAADPNTVWAEWGGTIFHTSSSETIRFAAGTTKIKVEYEPGGALASESYHTDYLMEIMPPALTESQRASISANYGYADGDAEGFGVGGYTWSGEAGNSASSVLHRVNASPMNLLISYTSGTSQAKANDKTELERWTGADWQTIHETAAWEGGARLVIPMPANVLENETRNRVRVRVLDAGNVEGVTDWVEFDVAYPGPSELPITAISTDETRGEITLQWTGSTLPENEFAGYEIRKKARGEKTERVHLETNQSTTSFTYAHVVAGREYELSVRQIKDIGTEVAQGEWRGATAVCDYGDIIFLKDVEDPYASVVPFLPVQGEMPTQSRHHRQTLLRAWGRAAPTKFRTEEAYWVGVLPVHFYDDALYLEGADERFEKLLEMIDRNATVAILSGFLPAKKVFATIDEDAAVDFIPLNHNRATIAYTEVHYPEDYLERED